MSAQTVGDTVAPDLEDLRLVTEDVWMALLGEAEELLPRSLSGHSSFDASEAWSAAVTVSGGWQGVITIELDATVARELSLRMLDLPVSDSVDDSDIADAVGELVNMVGGSVKSLMPGPSALSLPSVAVGRAAFASDVGEACRVDVTWRDRPVRISIHVPGGPR